MFVLFIPSKYHHDFNYLSSLKLDSQNYSASKVRDSGFTPTTTPFVAIFCSIFGFFSLFYFFLKTKVQARAYLPNRKLRPWHASLRIAFP